MALLVTTTRAFWCVDPDRACGYRVDSGGGAYYGISFDNDRIYVATRRSHYTAGKQRPQDQAGAVLVFDYDLHRIDVLEPPFAIRDVHQIYYFDNALWVVCTWNDLIAIHRERSWESWYPFGEPAGAAGGPYHLNSIYADGDHIYLGGSIDRVGYIWAFDRTTRRHRRTWQAGYGSHNVWCANESVFTLSSLAGEIVSTGAGATTITRGNFLRGAAVCADCSWFGISARARRGEREFSDAMLLGLSQRHPVPRRLNLPGFGMVHEIRAPGTADLAHPAAAGRPIDPRGLGGRFAALPMSGAPVLAEQGALRWHLARGVQRLDCCIRRRRLRRRGLGATDPL